MAIGFLVWRYLTQKAIDKVINLKKYFTSEKPKIIVHPGGMALEAITDQASHQQILANFIKSAKELNLDGVEFLPENLPPRPWYFGGQWIENAFCDLNDLYEICRQLNSRMCLDTSHAELYYNLTNQDYWLALEKVKKYIAVLRASTEISTRELAYPIPRECIVNSSDNGAYIERLYAETMGKSPE